MNVGETSRMSTILYPKVKIWFVNGDDEAIIGGGLARLLEAIEKYGSIAKASSNLNMSYRYALHRISLAEKRLGFKLVKTNRGGVSGGSSELTTEGKNLLTKYEEIEKKIDTLLKSKKILI